MELLIAHGLAEPRAARPPADRPPRQQPRAGRRARAVRRHQPRSRRSPPTRTTSQSWAAMLDDDGRLIRRLALRAGMGDPGDPQLQIGFDGARITIPVRDALRRSAGCPPLRPVRADATRRCSPSRARGSGSSRTPRSDRPEARRPRRGPAGHDRRALLRPRRRSPSRARPPGSRRGRQLLAGKRVTLVMDCDAPGRARRRRDRREPQRSRGSAVDVVDLAPDRNDGYDLTDRILERRRQHIGPLKARAVASLLRSVPTVNHTRRAYAPATRRR